MARRAPAAGAKSNSLPPEELLIHYRAIKDAEAVAETAKAKEATSALSAKRKAAEAAGLDMKAMRLLDALDAAGETQAKAILCNVASYSAVLDLPLFNVMKDVATIEPPAAAEDAVSVHLEWQAKGEGRRAALSGAPRSASNPYEAGSLKFVAFDRGWNEGAEERATAERMGDNAGVTPPAEPRKGRAKKNG